MKKIVRTRKRHAKICRTPLVLQRFSWRRSWSLAGNLLGGKVRVSLSGSLRDLNTLATKLGITPKRLAQARARGEKEEVRRGALRKNYVARVARIRRAKRLKRLLRNKAR